ncbi:MAG: hypothetical protein ACE5K4_09010 [Candidatus Hydrothermarchaeota archaeon]
MRLPWVVMILGMVIFTLGLVKDIADEDILTNWEFTAGLSGSLKIFSKSLPVDGILLVFGGAFLVLIGHILIDY